MATRWFGPRPINNSPVVRHGSCGCCGCGGFYSTDSVSDFDGLFTRYAAYRDGLRMKIVISSVPDSFAVDYNGIIFTTASGMSGYNGTWYFNIARTQYGCIFSSTDSETFDIEYNMSDPGMSYDLDYIQRVTMGCYVERDSTFLKTVGPYLMHYSPDYYANVMLSGLPYATNLHPMISLSLEPTDSQYYSGAGVTGFAPDGVTLQETTLAIADSIRLDNAISGNIRFRLSEALIEQNPMTYGFDDAGWTGVGTFWDTGTSDFKIAGTFTAEIERL